MFLKPWSFPVELERVQEKIRKKTGNDQGKSILLKGFFTRSHGRSLHQTNFEVLCGNFH